MTVTLTVAVMVAVMVVVDGSRGVVRVLVHKYADFSRFAEEYGVEELLLLQNAV